MVLFMNADEEIVHETATIHYISIRLIDDQVVV